MKAYEVLDRVASGITSAIEQKVDKDGEVFPYAIYKPHPPFAFGEVCALVISKKDAALFAASPSLLKACKKLLKAITFYGYTISDLFGQDEKFLSALEDMKGAIKLTGK